MTDARRCACVLMLRVCRVATGVRARVSTLLYHLASTGCTANDEGMSYERRAVCVTLTSQRFLCLMSYVLLSARAHRAGLSAKSIVDRSRASRWTSPQVSALDLHVFRKCRTPVRARSAPRSHYWTRCASHISSCTVLRSSRPERTCAQTELMSEVVLRVLKSRHAPILRHTYTNNTFVVSGHGDTPPSPSSRACKQTCLLLHSPSHPPSHSLPHPW